jgi:circadian clock protein KaiB
VQRCSEQTRLSEETNLHVLRLYVTGTTKWSQETSRISKWIYREGLHGRHEPEIIDVYQQPELAEEGPIPATSALLGISRCRPWKPVEDMSDWEKVILGSEIAMKKRADKEGNK